MVLRPPPGLEGQPSGIAVKRSTFPIGPRGGFPPGGGATLGSIRAWEAIESE